MESTMPAAGYQFHLSGQPLAGESLPILHQQARNPCLSPERKLDTPRKLCFGLGIKSWRSPSGTVGNYQFKRADQNPITATALRLCSEVTSS